LTEARKKAPGYLQSQFGEDIGIEATHLNKILKGTMAVGPKVIARVSKSVPKYILPSEAFRLIEDYLLDEFDQIGTERNAAASETETVHDGLIEAHIVVRPKRGASSRAP
jgi:hypothetical protein